LEEKVEILNWHDSNGQNQSATVKHFRSVFPNLNQGTISRWCKDSTKIREQFMLETGSSSRMRKRSCANPEFEEAMRIWVENATANPFSRLTGAAIIGVARRFYDTLEVPEAQRLSLSNGWLTKFLRRHGLRLQQYHGEAMSAPIENVEQECQRIKDLIQQFLDDGHSLSDIFNMDETSFFYAAIPDQGLTRTVHAGQKQAKIRLTLAVTVNATGDEVIPPLFIGKAKMPRCFQKKLPHEYGFQYENNTKAWMTGEIFTRWLRNWDRKLRDSGRVILLFLDNFAGHKVAYSPTNIQVEFLLPNLTAFVQPCDAGIIRTFKAIFRRHLVNDAIDKLFTLDITPDIFKINQLQEMTSAQQAWNELHTRPERISNCWKHCGILPDDNSQIQNELLQDHDEIHHLQEALDSLGIEAASMNQPLDLMDANSFLDIDNEELHYEILSDSQIVEMVTEPQAHFDKEEKEEEEDDNLDLIPAKHALQSLLKFQMYLSQNGICIPYEISKFLREQGSKMKERCNEGRKQKKITDFFKQ
jgi:regulator of replication initiation timing